MQKELRIRWHRLQLERLVVTWLRLSWLSNFDASFHAEDALDLLELKGTLHGLELLSIERDAAEIDQFGPYLLQSPPTVILFQDGCRDDLRLYAFFIPVSVTTETWNGVD